MDDSPPPIPTEAQIAQFQLRPEKAGRTKQAMFFAWIALGLLVVTVVVGGLMFRTSIAVLYPPSNKLFMAIGYPADTLGHGLTILKPQTIARMDGKDQVLSIKGQIENTVDNVIDIPLLRGAVRNTAQEDLHVWTFKADDARILPGEKVGYTTEVRNPPRGGTGLNFTFTKPEEAAADPKMKQGGPKSMKPHAKTAPKVVAGQGAKPDSRNPDPRKPAAKH
jgi:hypothetical protein